MTMQWREIHHNFFIDNYSPQEDVDNDDGSACVPPPPPLPPREPGARPSVPSPGADVGGVVRAGNGRGQPSPGADVSGVSPVLAQMWAG